VKLSVVMSVYSESRAIHEIVRQVKAIPIEKEVLIGDDGSADGFDAGKAFWRRSQETHSTSFLGDLPVFGRLARKRGGNRWLS
jgi:hypothetical protein